MTELNKEDEKSNIVEFFPANAAENPDNVLKQAMGVYDTVLIIGLDKDGYLDARASTNLKHSQALWFLEKFKWNLLAGLYEEDD